MCVFSVSVRERERKRNSEEEKQWTTSQPLFGSSGILEIRVELTLDGVLREVTAH